MKEKRELLKRLKVAEAKLELLKSVHFQVKNDGFTYCFECTDPYSLQHTRDWPCRTYLIVEGDKS